MYAVQAAFYGSGLQSVNLSNTNVTSIGVVSPLARPSRHMW